MSHLLAAVKVVDVGIFNCQSCFIQLRWNAFFAHSVVGVVDRILIAITIGIIFPLVVDLVIIVVVGLVQDLVIDVVIVVV